MVVAHAFKTSTQEVDLGEFQASLVYTVNSKTDRAT